MAYHASVPPQSSVTDLSVLASIFKGVLSPQDLEPSGITLPFQILDIIVAHGESIPSVIATYYRTIDVWLPIISRDRLTEQLDNIRTNPSSDSPLLLLCMYMIAKFPGDIVDMGQMRTSLYLQAKSLHSLHISVAKLSIELIQAGVLLCLYEQGHGMVDIAQMTIAATSRMGIKMTNAEKEAGTEDIQETELGRVWWSVVIMDR